MSKEIKKQESQLRDVREEMITDDYEGPLYIPEKYKREGYHRHIVDSTRGGRVERLLRAGYSIVHDDIKVGGNSVANPHSIDTAVRIHLGGSKEANGILMEIPQEKYDLRQKKKAEKASESVKSLGNTGIPTQTGEITIGNPNK